MSSRIRTIKPEWMSDEKLCFASADARVLSICLILLSDDHGNGRANSVWLNSQVFPGEVDQTRAARALDELVDIGFARRYEAGGQHYVAIRGWAKHQKIDRPSKPRVPSPPSEVEDTRESCGSAREACGNTREENGSARELAGNTREGQQTPQNQGFDKGSRVLSEPSRALPESSRLTKDQGPRTTTNDHEAVAVEGAERPHKLTLAWSVPDDDWGPIAALPIPDGCQRVLIRWYVNHHLDGDSRTPAEWRRSFRHWATRAWNERRTECLAESRAASEPVTESASTSTLDPDEAIRRMESV